MDVTNESEVTISSGSSVLQRTESNNTPQVLADLTNQWQPTYEHLQTDNSINHFYADPWIGFNRNPTTIEELPPKKYAIDQNNNNKRIPSFFRKAKLFCGSVLNKCKSSGHIEQGIDEITMQMVHLRLDFQ